MRYLDETLGKLSPEPEEKNKGDSHEPTPIRSIIPCCGGRRRIASQPGSGRDPE